MGRTVISQPLRQHIVVHAPAEGLQGRRDRACTRARSRLGARHLLRFPSANSARSSARIRWPGACSRSRHRRRDRQRSRPGIPLVTLSSVCTCPRVGRDARVRRCRAGSRHHRRVSRNGPPRFAWPRTPSASTAGSTSRRGAARRRSPTSSRRSRSKARRRPSATEVRFVYDDGALYVGARMFKRRARAIQAPMGRRDDGEQAEIILVSLDTFLDRRTAYVFGVTASGVRLDRYHPEDNESDVRRRLRSGVGGADDRRRAGMDRGAVDSVLAAPLQRRAPSRSGG